MTWFSGRPSSPVTSLEYHHPSKDVTVDNLLRNWTKLTSKEISESNSNTALEVTEGSGNKGKNRLMPAISDTLDDMIDSSSKQDKGRQTRADVEKSTSDIPDAGSQALAELIRWIQGGYQRPKFW